VEACESSSSKNVRNLGGVRGAVGVLREIDYDRDFVSNHIYFTYILFKFGSDRRSWLKLGRTFGNFSAGEYSKNLKDMAECGKIPDTH